MNKNILPTNVKQSGFQIKDFLGIDLTTQDSEVAFKRSPDSKNMVSGLKGSVDKRLGTKILNSEYQEEGKVHFIKKFSFKLKDGTEFIDKSFYFVHIGEKLLYGEDLEDLTVIQYRSGDTKTGDFLLEDGRINLFNLNSNMGYGFIFSSSKGLTPQILFLKASSSVVSVEGWSDYRNLEQYLLTTDATLLKENEGFLYYPITLINRKVGVKNYLSSTNAGTSFEQSNILTKYRYNLFYGDGSGKQFFFDRKRDTTIGIFAWTLDADGNWVETTAFTTNETSVTFTTAPSAPAVLGTDNVKILFAVNPYKTGTEKEIAYNPYVFAKSEVYNLFGLNGLSDYLFIGKSASIKTSQDKFDFVEWFGKFNTYAYFGEFQYTDFPSGISGYSDYGNLQIVHMKKSEIEPSINVRSATTDSNGEIVFPVQTGVSGVWIKAPQTVASFYDEPVWLGESGINAMVTNDVSGQNFAQDRGFYINESIIAEDGLENAIGFVYENRYHIALNKKVFVADNRFRYTEQRSFSKTYQYEWYYWEDVDLNSVYAENDFLYFGTTDGLICRFKKEDEQFAFSDEVKKDAYSWESGILIEKGDIVSYDSKYFIALRSHGTGSLFIDKNFNEVVLNGEIFESPVIAYWTTPILNMGNITVLKTLKNLWVRISRYGKSGVEIYYKVRGEISFVKQKNADIFSFSDIDFERFTFNTDSDPEVVVTNRMVRKFMSIQFKFQNSRSEQFSLIEVVGNYTLNSQYKG